MPRTLLLYTFELFFHFTLRFLRFREIPGTKWGSNKHLATNFSSFRFLEGRAPPPICPCPVVIDLLFLSQRIQEGHEHTVVERRQCTVSAHEPAWLRTVSVKGARLNEPDCCSDYSSSTCMGYTMDLGKILNYVKQI